MSEGENGGAAFPCQAGYDFKGERVTTTSEGMTLRDYFAAKALQGLLASFDALDSSESKSAQELYANVAYDYADAMLEARKK